VAGGEAAVPDGAAAKPQPKYQVEVLPGFPPFDNVDDPHPPDNGDLEANYLGQGDHSAGGATIGQVPYFDMNYGTDLGPFKHIQLKAEGGYSWRADGQGGGYQSGMGNVLFGVKWMFFTNEEENEKENGSGGPFGDMSLGVYPQIRIAPSSASVTKALAEGGKLYTFPFLLTKKFELGDRPIGTTFNAAYELGTGGVPDDFYWSGGIGVALTPKTAGEVSFSDERIRDLIGHSLVKVELGVVREVSDTFWLFAMGGRVLNVASNLDGEAHYVFNVGFQLTTHIRHHE